MSAFPVKLRTWRDVPDQSDHDEPLISEALPAHTVSAIITADKVHLTIIDAPGTRSIKLRIGESEDVLPRWLRELGREALAIAGELKLQPK